MHHWHRQKSVNNSAQLRAEFEPAPQCARLTLSARKTPGWAFGQNYQVMSSEDQYSYIQSWTTKKRRKTFTNIPFVAVLAVSRSRLSVATATRSSSEGLEGTLSFLPNGRTSGLPTSKNRVGIRFSVNWECRLLVYRWWQREVTIWGLGRRTTQDPSSQSVALCLFFVTWTQRCVCGSSIGGSLFLICSWLLWLSNHLNQKEKTKRKM